MCPRFPCITGFLRQLLAIKYGPRAQTSGRSMRRSYTSSQGTCSTCFQNDPQKLPLQVCPTNPQNVDHLVRSRYQVIQQHVGSCWSVDQGHGAASRGSHCVRLHKDKSACSAPGHGQLVTPVVGSTSVVGCPPVTKSMDSNSSTMWFARAWASAT